MTVPPQGEWAQERACTRLLGRNTDGSERVFEQPPVRHIIWDYNADDDCVPGWVCEEHLPEAAGWNPKSAHPVGPYCGMPGSRYIEERDVCECSDEIPTAEPVRAVSEPVPA